MSNEGRNAYVVTHLTNALLSLLEEKAIDNITISADIPLSEQIRTMISHFERNSSFYRLLNERGLIYLLKDVIIGIFGPKPDYEKEQAYAMAFVAYTLYGWIDTWFQRGMKETSDEIHKMFKLQGL